MRYQELHLPVSLDVYTTEIGCLPTRPVIHHGLGRDTGPDLSAHNELMVKQVSYPESLHLKWKLTMRCSYSTSLKYSM